MILGKEVNAVFFDWIYENALSLALLSLLILVFGFIAWRIVINKRRAAASPNPSCYGCPNAKACGGGCHTSSLIHGDKSCDCKCKKEE